jgi:hypothetical protein
MADVAAKISRNTGVSARYVDLPREVLHKAMVDQGMPAGQATALLDLQTYYTSGRGGEVDGLLQSLLGRAPVTMDKFLQESASAFRSQATGSAANV